MKIISDSRLDDIAKRIMISKPINLQEVKSLPSISKGRLTACHLLPSNRKYVIKVIKSKTCGKPDARSTFEYDRIVLCEHPHILKCYGKTKCSDGSSLLLLEHAANGNLENYYSKIGFKGADEWGNSEALKRSTRVELVW
jgi:serine/threonine protein kinase